MRDTSSIAQLLNQSIVFSAGILAVAGQKLPEWLGLYRKSHFITISDTSGFASAAVKTLGEKDGGTIGIRAFQQQVRLGVGKHFATFVWFLIPFYVSEYICKDYPFISQYC